MAEREGLKLKLYEKWRAGNEESWKQNGKVILLVHGATWASRCTFDPDPDHGYSMMEMLADAGYDVFAVDLHGYGRSERSDSDWTDSQSAAKDVEAAVEFIRALRWVEGRPAVLRPGPPGSGSPGVPVPVRILATLGADALVAAALAPGDPVVLDASLHALAPKELAP